MQAVQAEEEVRRWEDKREQQVFLAEDDVEHSKADLQLQMLAAEAGLDAFALKLEVLESKLDQTVAEEAPALETPQTSLESDERQACHTALGGPQISASNHKSE